jgi:two-component system sensor histidine kinase EvgS
MLQLIQTTGVNEEQANYVSIAIKSGMRLTRLLNDILDLSRVEANNLVLTESQFSLKGILSFIEERYTTECKEKDVGLLMNIDEGTPDEIVGDEIRIRQILVNLVSNAVKFTKTGRINVSISSEDISCYGAVNIIISVKDTGIGIADNMMTQIFEPFRQGENSYRRTFQGAGLGLTLVKHLVHIMNGTIKIDSAPGRGTSIDCAIMVKLPENQAIALKPVANEKMNRDCKPCTVLIAEDERINRLALKRILEKSGYRILEAENGLQALEILKTENPDCILMDIQMPEMDGIEASKNIRDKSQFGDKSSIPIIALTAYTMPEDREKISAAGLDDYISKPVNMDYLLKSISKFINA